MDGRTDGQMARQTDGQMDGHVTRGGQNIEPLVGLINSGIDSLRDTVYKSGIVSVSENL